MQEKRPDQKDMSIELARGMAIGFVVVEHTLSALLAPPGPGQMQWSLGLLIWAFVKVNVPVFLILSAALAFKKDLDPADLLIKKVKRVGPPLVFWGILYSIAFKPDNLNPYPILLDVLNGSAMYHLYFMYWFIGFFFFFPFVNYLFYQSTRSFYWYSAIAMIGCSLVPTINAIYGTKIYFFNATGIASFGFIVFYAFVPKLVELASVRFVFFRSSTSCFLAYVASCLLTYFATVFFFKQDGTVSTAFLNGGSFFILVSSLLFYSFMRNVSVDAFPEKARKAISLVGANAFGIYLVHPFILEPMLTHVYYPKISGMLGQNSLAKVAYLLIAATLISLLSLAVSIALRRTRVLARVV